MNIGDALGDEGGRASGDQAAALLEQAVQAYRSALEVNTKADLPRDWAFTQVHLGNALNDEGERASGEKAAGLLEQAAQAYRSTLEVYTKADFPRDWAKTQSRLGGLYHEGLFRYYLALEIEQQLFFFDSSTDNALGLIEANLTAEHFDVCAKKATSMATALSSGETIVRDTLLLPCAWAAGDTVKASAAKAALIVEASGLQKGFWTFTGDLHFLGESPAFASGRPAWIALFTAVQDGDTAGMTKALHELEPLMQN
jgi:tetratricopeptide (TPR) repeat protein